MQTQRLYKKLVEHSRRTGEKWQAALGPGTFNGWNITSDKTKVRGRGHCHYKQFTSGKEIWLSLDFSRYMGN